MDSVFIKRFPSKGELPKQDGIIVLTTNERLTYSKTFGWVTFQNYTTKAPEYWLEEIELPSEEDLSYDMGMPPRKGSDLWWHDQGFKNGANFILNKLKGETK